MEPLQWLYIARERKNAPKEIEEAVHTFLDHLGRQIAFLYSYFWFVAGTAPTLLIVPFSFM